MKVEVGDGIWLQAMLKNAIEKQQESRKLFEDKPPETPILDIPGSWHSYGDMLEWIDDDIARMQGLIDRINAERRRVERIERAKWRRQMASKATA